jgi:hypothetical protein
MDADVKRRHWGGSDALVAKVAAELGCSRAKAGTLMWGPNSAAALAARIVAALKRAGADETLVRFLQPLDEAMTAARPVDLNSDLFLVEQEADGDEGSAEVAYLAAPNRDTAQSFIRRAQRAAAALNQLVRAVRARWNLA